MVAAGVGAGRLTFVHQEAYIVYDERSVLLGVLGTTKDIVLEANEVEVDSHMLADSIIYGVEVRV